MTDRQIQYCILVFILLVLFCLLLLGIDGEVKGMLALVVGVTIKGIFDDTRRKN